MVPSVHDIEEIHDLLTREDAISMARDEITYLDDMSLDGDIPDDVSDIEIVEIEGMFSAS